MKKKSFSCIFLYFIIKSLNKTWNVYKIINPLPSIEELETKYKRRDLPEGAKVTRVAPSPTGFMHIGGIYAALINERLAHQSGGVFFLRIEDTDTKREVEGASEIIYSSLAKYGLTVDEGFMLHINKVNVKKFIKHI